MGCGGVRLLGVAAGGGSVFEVKHVWVQPNTRGRGLGNLLLAELESRAAAFGARDLVLDTNRSLTAANALYRAAGWFEIDAYNQNPNATNWYAKSLPIRPGDPTAGLTERSTATGLRTAGAQAVRCAARPAGARGHCA